MSDGFYAIVDEDEGIYLVFKETMTVELLAKRDIEFIAKKMNVTVSSTSRIDLIYAVAGKLATDIDFSSTISAFRDGNFPFMLALPLANPVGLSVGRGHRAVTRSHR
jgi:hypothetical protein